MPHCPVALCSRSAQQRPGLLRPRLFRLTFSPYISMPRATNKPATRRRRKKILNMAKGYWGRRSKVYTVAKHAVEKGLQYAYRDRRQKKRRFRQLWITRINAAARQHGVSYSQFMGQYRKSDLDMNRKVLADLAVHDPDAFEQVVQHVTQ